MLKQSLSLLQDKPNIFDLPQETIDTYLIDESEQEQFLSTVKLFSNRAKKHFTHKYVQFHIDNNFKYFDVVKISEYPLPAVYNKKTNKCIINISAFGKRSVANIDMRDIYTLIVYSHVCMVLSIKTIPDKFIEPFCEYMSLLFLKVYSKKYGITGSYVDLIPQFKFLVSYYILITFFGWTSVAASTKASHIGKFDPRKFQIKLGDYDFMKPDGLVAALSDTQITPGLNMYRFIDTMLRYFGVMSLPIFEDLMRFCCVICSSSINGNSYFSPGFQIGYGPSLYLKLNTIILHVLDK